MTIQPHHLHTHGPDPMRPAGKPHKARIIAKENGISVRQAYRRLRNIKVSAENENFDYEAETPKGEWV